MARKPEEVGPAPGAFKLARPGPLDRPVLSRACLQPVTKPGLPLTGCVLTLTDVLPFRSVSNWGRPKPALPPNRVCLDPGLPLTGFRAADFGTSSRFLE
ncbi:unnamed protein product [Bursaphelenchus xylophilus]|uniref:(pine wood nematode) hypothetical protein n=1 Tax=Bursaphelenchus xylophilus TaxID=6326 RepID=A0A1I7RQB3_BURXY|nr:unnamed protein product [Bursaphelenchus xylophilus]CAG9104301.1 unnamed protein product [Bursaphelenchus xylophilus]